MNPLLNELSPSQCQSIVTRLRQVFNTEKTRPYEFRKKNILGIKQLLIDKEDEICAAMKQDLGRSKYEAVVFEITVLKVDIDNILKNLKSWMEPKPVATPVAMLPGSSYIESLPYGVALVIGPFNYPIQLTLWPMVGAIAGGNVAVVKPSELTPSCCALLEKYLPMYIDKECFQVVNGAVETTKSLLAQKWDKIFFTGSSRVGKIVMRAASEHLTSVTLELGGKSPTIVDESVGDVSLVANRIMWGKLVNAGQTCIAPDYILCHANVYDKLLTELKKTTTSFLGNDPSISTDFCRIVSVNYAERLNNLIKAENPENIVLGGESDVSNRYIPPTIIKDVMLSSKLLQEEIFGPILPVVKYHDLNEIIDTVSQVGENPLALYIFARNQQFTEAVKNAIPSGGCVVNDIFFQAANNNLPFGGKGASGIGSYHGIYTFKCFTHERGLMYRDDHKLLDLSVRYPPYDIKGLALMNFIAGLPSVSQSSLRWALLFSGAIAVALGVGLGVRFR